MDTFWNDLDSCFSRGICAGLLVLILLAVLGIVLLAVCFLRLKVFSNRCCCCKPKVIPLDVLADTANKGVQGMSYNKSAARGIFHTATSEEQLSTIPSAVIIHGSRSSVDREQHIQDESTFKSIESDTRRTGEHRRPSLPPPRIRQSVKDNASPGEDEVFKRPFSSLPISQSSLDYNFTPESDIQQLSRPFSSHLTRRYTKDHATKGEGENKKVSPPQHLIRQSTPDYAAYAKRETKPPSPGPLIRQSVMDHANTAQTVNNAAGRFLTMARKCLGKARQTSALYGDVERGELGEGRGPPSSKTVYEAFLDVRSAQVSLLAAELMLKKDNRYAVRHEAVRAGAPSTYSAANGLLAVEGTTTCSGDRDAGRLMRFTATDSTGATSGSASSSASSSLVSGTIPFSDITSPGPSVGVSSSNVLSPPAVFNTHFPPNRSSTPFPPNGSSAPPTSAGLVVPPSAASRRPSARAGNSKHSSPGRQAKQPRATSVSPAGRTGGGSGVSGSGGQSPLFRKLMSRYLAVALSHQRGARASGSAAKRAGANAAAANLPSTRRLDDTPNSVPTTTATAREGRTLRSAATPRRCTTTVATSSPLLTPVYTPNSVPTTPTGGRAADSAIEGTETPTHALSSSTSGLNDVSSHSVLATPSRLSGLSVILPEDSFNGALVTETDESAEERQRKWTILQEFVDAITGHDDPRSWDVPLETLDHDAAPLDNRTFIVSKKPLRDGENQNYQDTVLNPPTQRTVCSPGSKRSPAQAVRSISNKRSIGKSIVKEGEKSIWQLVDTRQPSCLAQRKFQPHSRNRQDLKVGLQVFESEMCKLRQICRGRTSNTKQEIFEHQTLKEGQEVQGRTDNIQQRVPRGQIKNTRQISKSQKQQTLGGQKQEPCRYFPCTSSSQDKLNTEAITGFGNSLELFSAFSLTTDTDSFCESSSLSVQSRGCGGLAHSREAGSDGSCEESDSALSSSSHAQNVITLTSSSCGSPLYDNNWREVPRVSVLPSPAFALKKTSL